ncbi:TIGR02587 family membrane protein [Rufibacter glacialis]|uniref:TIGR02587 family membrane protein n=1 Tax=Rufibacter glacialis TaxID=1259555 RepID=A0A5M8QT41_9BACT|nr:TIGR02587 family membrane protein [Rufibacter glacialis]KAA6437372.1 TIGR02587 family membrane protein [Rufibacter glacialis]GGK59823.1 membrane protein [Rufibacter glacialis]
MRNKSIGQSLQEYGRGVIGGLLFSLPLLYTMEVWWTSFQVSPWLLILYIVVTAVLLLGYNTYAGLRSSASWKEIAVDSVEEMGLGLVLAFLFLWLLGVVQVYDMSLERIIYMTVIEAMPVAIGVSIGTAQLGTSGEDEEEDEAEEKDPEDSMLPTQNQGQASTLEQIMLATCASMLFGANIAPTEEVIKISADANPLQLLLVFFVSLALNGAILFYVGFRGSYETPANEKPKFLEVVWGLSLTYATAFCTSAGALWFFGRFDGVGLQVCIEATVVLGMVSSLGASAGRFLFDQEYK